MSTDPPERSREIAAAYGIEFALLADTDAALIDAFGVRHRGGNPVDGTDIARPATFLVDRDGRIVWRDLTANWRVRPRPETLLVQLASIP